jgi:phage baseplate assembly protein W
MTTYSGFSTVNKTKKFRLTDFDLVKQDITNHFNIRKGEKLMNPDFGTIIWDTLFEPLNDETKNVIMQDVKRIVASDPRIGAKNVTITEFDRGLQLQIDLIYIPTNQVSTMAVKFEQNSKTTKAL